MTETKTTKKAEATRLAMIEAAIEIFGRDGFHAASNRSLASAAGVNLALISYHFGGKEGLYVAVFEHMAAKMKQHFEPVLVKLMQGLMELNGPEPLDEEPRLAKIIDLIESLLFALIEMLASHQTEPWARLILREQQTPSAAFEVLFSGPMGRSLAMLSKLVALALNRKETDIEVKLCALNLIGQVQSLRAARATIMYHTGWQSIGEEEIKLLKKQMRFTVRSLFMGNVEM
ncbi:MAG: CerR family C-terminal domain-containing protein [Bermanella sp.]